MKQTRVNIGVRIPTRREHRRKSWSLREAVKFSIVELVRKELLLLPEKPKDPCQAVEIGTKVGIPPEKLYIDPILDVLRADGWIHDRTTVILTPSTKGGVFIEFEV